MPRSESYVITNWDAASLFGEEVSTDAGMSTVMVPSDVGANPNVYNEPEVALKDWMSVFAKPAVPPTVTSVWSNPVTAEPKLTVKLNMLSEVTSPFESVASVITGMTCVLSRVMVNWDAASFEGVVTPAGTSTMMVPSAVGVTSNV